MRVIGSGLGDSVPLLDMPMTMMRGRLVGVVDAVTLPSMQKAASPLSSRRGPCDDGHAEPRCVRTGGGGLYGGGAIREGPQ